MTWVKIDDQFQDHPKFLDVSLAGVGLWVAGLAYSNRYLTDGLLTANAVRRLGGNTKLISELVAAGLWQPVDGGWLIHDYTDYNPPASRVQATRAKRKASGQKGGQARAKQIAKQTPAIEPGKDQARGPRPRPVRLDGTGEIPTSSSQGVQGDDDDGKLPAVQAAIDALAARDLAERQAKPGLRPIGDVDAWLDRARCRRWADQGGLVRTLAEQGRDADAIVAALTEPTPPALLAAVAVPPTPEELASRALCECGMPAGHRSGCAEAWRPL